MEENKQGCEKHNEQVVPCGFYLKRTVFILRAKYCCTDDIGRL